MRTADILCAAIIGCIGLISIGDAIRMGSGWEMDGPQAGFFPFLLGSVIVVGCVAIVWRAIRGQGVSKSGKPFVPPGALRPVLWVVIPASLMVLLTEFIGLYAAAAIYLLTYIRWVGGHGWRVALPISILTPLLFYVVFDRVFLIPMPQGLFGGLLGF